MGNTNSSSKSKVYGKAAKVGSIETEQGYGTKVSAFRDEYIDIAKSNQHGLGMQKWNAPLDNDDTFNDFIQRSKCKIRSTTMSNNVWEQSNSAPAPAALVDEVSEEENEREKFSKFIQITKKKLRTTSSLRKNSFFQRGE